MVELHADHLKQATNLHDRVRLAASFAKLCTELVDTNLPVLRKYYILLGPRTYSLTAAFVMTHTWKCDVADLVIRLC